MEYNNVSVCCGAKASFEDFGSKAIFCFEKEVDGHILCMYFCRNCYSDPPAGVKPSDYHTGFKHRKFFEELKSYWNGSKTY